MPVVRTAAHRTAARHAAARRVTLSAVLVAGGVALAAVAPAAGASGPGHSNVGAFATVPGGTRAMQVTTLPETATPQGPCGPGSLPETGLQGRAPGDGTATDGFRCNVQVVGSAGASGGFKVERYVDAAGHECAFYDTTLLFPSNAANLVNGPTGVDVLDMSDPAHPVRTATLSTPAMQTPHESLVVNARRGLVAAVAGNALFAPGQVDLYDASGDCRHPVLASSLPIGILGHESGFAPDGNTFYAASLGGGVLTAIDVTDPTLPVTLTTIRADTHALTLSDDGRTAYLAATAGFPRNEVGLTAAQSGVVVLDVSQIQDRVPNPQTSVVGGVTWPSITIPQSALPVTIDGRPYLVESDEFSNDENGRLAANGPRVGAARIIDIADPAAPQVVSNLRLQVHDPAVRPTLAGDPGATSFTGGYAGHYCAVPRRVDPQIVACSFLASGLRVFDIRDPQQPREIAYYVAPLGADNTPNAAFASASFVPERSEIWYSDGSRGLSVLRLTNGVWPAATTAPGAPVAAPVAAAPQPAAAPAPTRGGAALPATGPALPFAAALVLLLVAGLVRRLSRRPRPTLP